MDFDLDKTSTKAEADNCDAKKRLQDDTLSCLTMDIGKQASSSLDSLPSLKLTDEKEESKTAKANELPEMDMSRHRHHYPTSYRYPHLPPSSHVGGTRYEVHGGKVVVHR